MVIVLKITRNYGKDTATCMKKGAKVDDRSSRKDRLAGTVRVADAYDVKRPRQIQS